MAMTAGSGAGGLGPSPLQETPAAASNMTPNLDRICEDNLMHRTGLMFGTIGTRTNWTITCRKRASEGA
jgi:hypothetical protein